MKSQAYDPSKPDATGCIIEMPNDAYHAHPSISHSKLWAFRERPRKFQGKYITGEIQRDETQPMRDGSALHTAVLEPERFKKEYAILPEQLSWRSKADKAESVAAYAETMCIPLTPEEEVGLTGMNKPEIEAWFYSQKSPVSIIHKETYEWLLIAQEKIRQNRFANELIQGGLSEVTFRTEKLALGYQIQCRFDRLNVEGCNLTNGLAYGFDLKSVASLERWPKEFQYRGYYRAYPFYCKTQEMAMGKAITRQWFWLVVEKEWPYTVVVKSASPECWQRGMAEISLDMTRLGECMAANHYPEPGEKQIEIQTLPDWMLIHDPREPGLETGGKYEPPPNWGEENDEDN